MKKSILILGCFLISCVAFGYTPIEKNANTETYLITTLTDYPVVGTTQNSIGENFSIGITVRIDDTYGTMSVYVGRTQVSYNMESYGKYSIQYGDYGSAQYYYFSFNK